MELSGLWFCEEKGWKIGCKRRRRAVLAAGSLPTAWKPCRCNGTPNACSFLYARVARVARLLGYTRILTYTLEAESGASLKAVGAKVTGQVEPQEWSVPSRPRRTQEVYREAKVRWEL